MNTISSSLRLESVLQHKGDLEVNLVALYVAVLDQDVLVLHPGALHAPERLGGTCNGLVDGVLEAGLRGGAQLGDSRNTHEYPCLLIVACCLQQVALVLTRMPYIHDRSSRP